MSRYRETMAEALKRVYEDGHEDVASSKRMCQTIIEDATQIRTKLDSMSAEDKLDTWWTNKLAKSADNMNSARDYIMNPIEESFEFSLDEGRMKTIYTMQQQGKSAKEIAKYMKLPVKTIKDILGEDLEEKIRPFMLSYSKGGSHEGFEDADTLPELQRKAASLRSKGFTIDKMGRYNPPVKKEETINEADINVDNVKKGDSEKEKELKIKLDKEKPSRKLDVTLEPNGIVAETVVYENKLIEGGSGNELMVARIYTDNKSQEKEYFVEFADVYYNLSTFEYTNIELCPGEYDNIPTIKNTPGLEIRNLGDFDNPVLVDNLVFDFGEKGFISDLRLKNITFDIDNAKAAVNIENRIHNVWIENCIFRSEDGIGISNNKLRQYYEGALYSNIHIANNKFHNHRIAILLQDYYKVYINDNEFLDYNL